MIPNSCFFPVFGKPIAKLTCMILVIMRMKVISEKRLELTISLHY